MDAYFDSIFEDVRHERSLILLLAIVEPDLLRQSKFLDHDIEIIKDIGLENLNRQRTRKEIIALELLEIQIDNYIYLLLFKY